MVRGVSEAWSLEPIGKVKLGPREHPVPPLTFGRFQRLLASEPQKILAALVETAHVKGQTVTERLMERALRWAILRHPRVTPRLWQLVELFGLGKRHRPMPGVEPWVRICVPTVEPGEWEKHGGAQAFCALFLMFARAHDWEFISEAIRFGEPAAPGEIIPTRTQVTAGLMAVAKEAGYTIEELHAMRLDGFYTLVEAIREQHEDQTREEGGLDSLERTAAPDRVEALTALTDYAERPPDVC